MPLETGTWTINSNGNLGQLIITSVDAAGNVTGSLKVGNLVNATPIAGLWDEASGKLLFTAGIQFTQSYTGFLFQDQFRIPGIRGGVVATLAGYYEAFFSGGGATADRLVFGWYAQIGAT